MRDVASMIHIHHGKEVRGKCDEEGSEAMH